MPRAAADRPKVLRSGAFPFRKDRQARAPHSPAFSVLPAASSPSSGRRRHFHRRACAGTARNSEKQCSSVARTVAVCDVGALDFDLSGGRLAKPPIIRSVVVFPQPLGPSSAKSSPLRRESDTPATATTSPKERVTLERRTEISSSTAPSSSPSDAGSSEALRSRLTPSFQTSRHRCAHERRSGHVRARRRARRGRRRPGHARARPPGRRRRRRGPRRGCSRLANDA